MKQLTILCMAALFSAAAHAEQGKIRICRHHGLTEMMDHKKISVPAGSSFTTSGETSDYVVATTQDVILDKKPGCAIAPAKMTENQSGKHITRKSGILEPQFSTPGATLEARVVEDFK